MVEAVLELEGMGEPLQRGVSAALILREDRRLEPFPLPAQRRAQDGAPYLMLKDSPGGRRLDASKAPSARDTRCVMG